MEALVAKPDHGQALIDEDKAAKLLQLWFDELELKLNQHFKDFDELLDAFDALVAALKVQVQLPVYTVATLPSGAVGGLISDGRS